MSEKSCVMDFLVGTFNTPQIHSLRFTPPSNKPASLDVTSISKAVGFHSWLTLSADRKHLYATAWTKPPAVAAYHVKSAGEIELINSKQVKSTNGYVACSNTHIYSVSGPSGEVFTIAENGGVGELVQEISFVESTANDGSGLKDSHGSFGGLRHGAHSVDISPDGRSLYIADIGRNCVWTYSITASSVTDHLVLGSKHISPRSNDGPRHTTPHPNGKVLYCLQEHSSMVDAFLIARDGVTLSHATGVKIIPPEEDPKDYWADEVRLSTNFRIGDSPKYLYASTRGLESHTKGYVAVYELQEDGAIKDQAVTIFQTPTSGGIANAVEPAPQRLDRRPGEHEYVALTDSQEGWVFVLGFDGQDVSELARVKLECKGVEVVAAATAVWL